MSVLDPALYWLIIGVMLFFLELALPGFILFFFAVGALVTAMVAWLTPISIAWQLGLFIVASLGTLLALRDIIQRNLFATASAEQEEDKDEILAVPGDKCVVSMTIPPPAEGRIKYSGTFWRATADELIEEGEIVSVVRQDGIVIHVEKV
jgi:membrane protein implicated in regulation of membrane protease activity